MFAPPAVAAAADQPASADAAGNQDIVVTATRRQEPLRKVPINVTAYSKESMDMKAIRRIDDLATITPDLHFATNAGPSFAAHNVVSIRGIESTVGAPTTGIYIDDTPIQGRSLLQASSSGFPDVFDLERVEVLRGPQGTLFGAGSEGGAIRFITPQPDFEKMSAYARAEGSQTAGGDASYEGGVAVGGPIVTDKIAFRASIYNRHDGGYIDRVTPDNGETTEKNINWRDVFATKVALAVRPVDGLTITPSLFYQTIDQHNPDEYWNSLTTDGGKRKTGARAAEPEKEKLFLPSLKAELETGGIRIISNSSYFRRSEAHTYDETSYISDLFFGTPYVYSKGDTPSPEYVVNRQKEFTQEVRIQNSDGAARINWTVGVFYTHRKQSAYEGNVDGSQVVAEELAPLLDGIYGLKENVESRENEIAGFANLDVNLTSKLKAQLGVRVSHNKLSYSEVDDGPINGGYTAYQGKQKETPVTPKFGLSYQLNRDSMVYFSASKGFRSGGAQASVPKSFCSTDLGTLGLDSTPQSYKSDSVWAYELGMKNKLFGGKVTIDASVYRINWSNRQQSVELPTCGFSYISNFGSVTSQGIDFAATARVARGFTMGVNLGYDDVRVDGDEYEPASSTLIARKNDRIGDAPFVATLTGDYEAPIGDRSTFYAHADYTYRSHAARPDPETYSYDVLLPGAPANDYLTVRAGIRFDRFDISVFAKNLTNDLKALGKSDDFVGSELLYETGYRPRTVGATAIAHF